MKKKNILAPDYLFEVSWEVCNKVGGIHTVISTKYLSLQANMGDQLIMIGPDVWKETESHPEFIPDQGIYESWRIKAEKEGYKIRIGRWNIPGNPVAILIDFTPFFAKKDEIFTLFWEKYELDSLTGSWDYIEPAIFGYTAARVIESFYEFYITSEDLIVAQFHEWMTGTGVLYLKEYVPQVGTLFTTHATVLGRTIAGNNLPLYAEMENYHPDSVANRFNIRSKYSLEKTSARESDCFTTVSKITSRECAHFLKREVDVITTNGFEDSFVPSDQDYLKKRKNARKKLRDLAAKMTGKKCNENTLFVLTSGRYEYRNKGIDHFIDALGKLNKMNPTKNIIAFIAVPAHQKGVVPELKSAMMDKGEGSMFASSVTHILHNAEIDPVLHSMQENDLNQKAKDQVKLIFIPSYLDGNDGIINLHYYDFLIGFDVTVFPSYYEPWGYTPMESMAFSIPTITTTYAGFGQWIKDRYSDAGFSACVLDGSDSDKDSFSEKIADTLYNLAGKTNEQMEDIRNKAKHIAEGALWKHMIANYHEAFDVALQKALERKHLYRNKVEQDKQVFTSGKAISLPYWRKLLIKPSIPENLIMLRNLSKNLWWAWNEEAIELFESIDPEGWAKWDKNPVALLENTSYYTLKNLEANPDFKAKYDHVVEKFQRYMNTKYDPCNTDVAYFSMEYGLHDTIKIYSGGLGMLAGDFLKEASDSNINMIGIGLLYRYGYFRQEINHQGDQVSVMQAQKFTHLPVVPVRDKHDNLITIKLALPGRTAYAKIWRVDVGRIPLFLMDTDIEENTSEDRSITHQLYGGSWENRFLQELLLGVGGIRVIRAMGIDAKIYHLNEGHAAFTGMERLREYVQLEKLSLRQAVEMVKSTTLFTTHTPVPAGHDAFEEDTLRMYIPHYADRLNMSWEAFMEFGRINNDQNEKFSMSILAAKLAQEMNGVSRIHGHVSRNMFKHLYPGFFEEESHIDYVTNGVHYHTWTAPGWKQLHREIFENTDEYHFLPDSFARIKDVDDERIWNIRNQLKLKLTEYLKTRLTGDLMRRGDHPHFIVHMRKVLAENALTIGFARRFATYKRAHLLFRNPDRLAEIVNNKEKPVRFIFAGKAHPNDKAGQDLIKRIIEYTYDERFVGKIIYVENYDMELGKMLLQGCDIWLNTPTRPLEASGTSGQKAALNGVLNFSVLDGWWAEGYKAGAGWALEEHRTYSDQNLQDELDAENIYYVLEQSIIPLYFKRNDQQIPDKWIAFIKNDIADIAPAFTMKRMLDEYQSKFYHKLLLRKYVLQENHYEKLRSFVAWKRKVINAWNYIEVVEVSLPDFSTRPMSLNDHFEAELKIDLKGLTNRDIAVQIIFGHKQNDEVQEIVYKENMHASKMKNGLYKFKCTINLSKAGVYDYGFRLIPKNDLLVYSQDLGLVKWI